MNNIKTFDYGSPNITSITTYMCELPNGEIIESDKYDELEDKYNSWLIEETNVFISDVNFSGGLLLDSEFNRISSVSDIHNLNGCYIKVQSIYTPYRLAILCAATDGYIFSAENKPLCKDVWYQFTRISNYGFSLINVDKVISNALSAKNNLEDACAKYIK